MVVIRRPLHAHRKKALPPLENGDRLDQKTFHARYEAMPEDCRAELTFTDGLTRELVGWLNGVDLCHDVLYSIATGKPIRVPEPA